MEFKRTTPTDFASQYFLTDAGLETDMIFNRGQELPEFAAHTLLSTVHGREQLTRYFNDFLALAEKHQLGFVLDSQTWRAQRVFAEALNTTPQELERINRDAIEFIASIKVQTATNMPVLLNGVIGPCGDGYAPSHRMTTQEAQRYHAEQIAWLANTQVEMLTGLTLTYPEEAIGMARAARTHGLPFVVSFTVETDGKLPSGDTLEEAILLVDNATLAYPDYYMINCAHPDHFSNAISGRWTQRLGGVRCNASRCSHAELDESETLDAGDPQEFGHLSSALAQRLPSLRVFGGCCGSDVKHVKEIATSLNGRYSQTG